MFRTHVLAIALLGILSPLNPELAVNANTILQDRPYSPIEALRSARAIFIRTKSAFFKPATLEDELLKRDEFLYWDMSITRVESDADLIIEVDRMPFTTHFVYSVLDPRSNKVVAAGKVDSIGGTVEHKIANSFIKKLMRVRSALPSSKT
jgi:hypothetical protein